MKTILTITAPKSNDSEAVTYMIRGKMMSKFFSFGFLNRFTSIFYHTKIKK